jgi:hypothetical protein
MYGGKLMQETLLSQIMVLKGMSARELQKRYEDLFDGKKASSNNKIYLWRRIVHRIQELEYGGIPEEAKGKIKELVEECDPINNRALRPEYNSRKKFQTLKWKHSTLRDKRLPIPGTIVRKEYKGNHIHVEVLENGFVYKGKKYKSLSAIAKEITGAHWNGYLFFNL